GNAPKPDEWADNPALEFDTFVSGPGFASPTILGRKEGSGAAIFSATEVNVAWGDLVTTGAGVFTAARLTMTNDAAGDLTGVLYAKSAPATAKPYAAQIKPQATTGTITGYVFNDQDANGGKGATEPKLPNWQVYIDGNNNGRLDSGERSVKTRSNGNFTISDVPAGTHRLRLVLQSGWRRTAPANSSFSHNVTVTAGATAANKKFGVTQQGVSTSQRVASVQGRVVALPSHARAITEEDLKPLSGWRVFIDRNNDGRFAVGEENTRTDSEGRFTFANLQPGTYRLRLTQVEGFAPFEPQNNLITVVLGAGQVSSGHTFSQKAV
ncbi:MAG: carboxypeptidase regulatory-like domain-containing protein, partial [Phycisphaerae bacterium]|nr:carboxypeptidase regulatory-like domain-containing protein [Phycisphaerae bacterium]